MDGIKDTIFKLLRIDNLVDNLSGYVDARVKLLKIEIKEDVAKIMAKGLVQASIILVALLFLFFISFGIAEFLNIYFENAFKGYLIVSGLYFLLFIVLIIFRKNIYANFERYFSGIINSNKD